MFHQILSAFLTGLQITPEITLNALLSYYALSSLQDRILFWLLGGTFGAAVFLLLIKTILKIIDLIKKVN